MSKQDDMPRVSVLCITYNHENYVRKTLEGFLMQETDFPVEFIIHDDASTDKTAEIIRSYAAKCPDKFVLLLDTENQYSQGKDYIREQMLPIAKGEYLAMCEGDDYWTDPKKLQRQYDMMKAHPECSCCVHRVRGISLDEKKTMRVFPMNPMQEGVVKAETVIKRMLMDVEWIFHTTSFFFQKRVMVEAYEKEFDFMINPMYGDQSIIFSCCIYGDFYFIDEFMSAYRMGVPGGMMMLALDPKVRKERCTRALGVMDSLDQETGGRYHKYTEWHKEYNKFQIAECDRDYAYMLKKDRKQYFVNYPKYKIIQIHIARYFPFADTIYYFFRKLVKGY